MTFGGEGFLDLLKEIAVLYIRAELKFVCRRPNLHLWAMVKPFDNDNLILEFISESIFFRGHFFK